MITEPYCKIQGNSSAWLHALGFLCMTSIGINNRHPMSSHNMPSEATIGKRILSQNQNYNYSLFKGRCGRKMTWPNLMLFILEKKHILLYPEAIP